MSFLPPFRSQAKTLQPPQGPQPDALMPPEHACVQDTRAWLERAVIGLNLCPFARAPHVRGQIHYAVTLATTHQGLLDALDEQARALLALAPEQRETTLLIVPGGLEDFLMFNSFVGAAQRMMARAGMQGRLQLASFHPGYEFAGSDPQEMGNFSNRSPWPTLHLLREDSVERAVDAMADPQAIYEANIETLQRLGRAGWEALKVGRT